MKKEENKTIIFETFRKISQYTIDGLKQEQPDCFNGNVSVEKYKVTIEPIVEPKNVYQERLQKLWDECDNHHHWMPLRYAAQKYGVEIKGDAGSKRNKKW